MFCISLTFYLNEIKVVNYKKHVNKLSKKCFELQDSPEFVVVFTVVASAHQAYLGISDLNGTSEVAQGPAG